MHTCSHTPLALAAKQKQTFPGEEVSTGQLLPGPVERLPGTSSVCGRARSRAGSAVPWACSSPSATACSCAQTQELPADDSKAVAAFPLLLLFLLSPSPKEVQLPSKSSPSARPQRHGRLLWGIIQVWASPAGAVLCHRALDRKKHTHICCFTMNTGLRFPGSAPR